MGRGELTVKDNTCNGGKKVRQEKGFIYYVCELNGPNDASNWLVCAVKHTCDVYTVGKPGI